ncbi:MAG: rubredoxin [Pseudomonadota bacterium]|nr:rubredoxin [Pseudomonadota bacterium]
MLSCGSALPPPRSAGGGAPPRLECRICWYVYDPAEGDPVEQVPPGTAFSALPAHWRCPQCDADKGMFLPVDE